MQGFDEAWAAVLAALPEIGIEERTTLEQHARTLWRDVEPKPSWMAAETVNIIQGRVRYVWRPNPRMMEYRQPIGHWERIATDDRHRQ